MNIDLSEEEREVLVDLLNETPPNLRSEVYKTEQYDYRESLKRREALLLALRDKIGRKLQGNSA